MKAKGQGQRFTPPEKEEQLREELAAKALKAKIDKADKENRRFRQRRYPEKSMLQILRKLRELGAFNEAVAIAKIKRRWKQLSPDEIPSEEKKFVAEEEEALRQRNQPPIEEDCPI